MTDIAMVSNTGGQDRTRLQKTLILAVLGALGAASFYFTDLIPEEAMRIRALIGPMLMVGITLLLGHFFATKAGIRTPFLDAVLNDGGKAVILKSQAKAAFICALLYGVVIGIPGYFIEASLAPDVAQSLQSFGEKVHILTKLFWGSLSEEIVMRWGILAFMLWVVQKVLRKAPRQVVIWTALVLGSGITTLVHAPTIYAAVQTPPMTLVVYTIGAGFLTAIMAGYVVVKKGLEAGMIYKFIVLTTSILLGLVFN